MIDILVVDDDATFGELTLERLEGMGWEAQFHLGPFGTVNAIRAVQPRLLIMDVNMPGLDGPAIHEIIKKRGDLKQMKVLLVSSLDQRELERVAQNHGIEHALNKSSSGPELRKHIKELLGAPRL
jgi:CheY-like chemotaxis protein